MKTIKYITIILLVILLSCTGTPQDSAIDNPDAPGCFNADTADDLDCLNDETDQDGEEVDYFREGIFLPVDPSMWPRN
ncbi:MAG: hypothetical protein FWG07_07890 [Treponema sp.]|nr:hypothetical protein [Treponema sp.]